MKQKYCSKKACTVTIVTEEIGHKKCLITQALKKSSGIYFDLFYNHFLGNIKLIIEYKSDDYRLIGNTV
ncbi:MAG: hypothetical protein RL705_721 [Bacteroidota bacterium]|jgi:predicted RNA-binding protein